MAIEVEIKAKIKNLKQTESKLKEFGAKFIGEERQVDQYYNSPAKDLTKIEEYLRVREKGSKVELGYHIVLSKNSAREYETLCNDKKAIDLILKNIGCKKLGVINKLRKKYKLNWAGKQFNIVLDDVKGIGLFIEFELMVQKRSNIEQAEKDINKLMIQFGISEKDTKVPRLSQIATQK